MRGMKPEHMHKKKVCAGMMTLSMCASANVPNVQEKNNLTSLHTDFCLSKQIWAKRVISVPTCGLSRISGKREKKKIK